MEAKNPIEGPIIIPRVKTSKSVPKLQINDVEKNTNDKKRKSEKPSRESSARVNGKVRTPIVFRDKKKVLLEIADQQQDLTEEQTLAQRRDGYLTSDPIILEQVTTWDNYAKAIILSDPENLRTTYTQAMDAERNYKKTQKYFPKLVLKPEIIEKEGRKTEVEIINQLSPELKNLGDLKLSPRAELYSSPQGGRSPGTLTPRGGKSTPANLTPREGKSREITPRENVNSPENLTPRESKKQKKTR